MSYRPEFVGILVLDEAHTFKNPVCRQWRLVRDLRARYRLLLTGTPVSNSISDLLGVMGIMEHHHIWDDFGLEAAKCDPFTSAPGSDQAVLLCTQRAVEIVEKIPKTDFQRRGQLVKRIYEEAMLKRTYITEINGVPIGLRIPPHKKVKVSLRTHDNMKDRHYSIMASHKKGLYRYGRSNGKGTIVMDAGKARQLSHCTTFLGFNNFNLKADGCKEFRNSNKSLRHMMALIAASRGDLGFGLETVKHDRKELLLAVANQSVKLRYLSYLAAYITIPLDTKMIVWVEYPWQQLLVEKFLMHAGKGTIVMDAGKARQSSHCTTSLGFNNFNLKADGCKKFRNSNKHENGRLD